jgi:simple sugar transport system ATP-binding protein
MVRSIYGADRPDSGELSIKGKKKKITAPIDAMKAGMGFLPEDRKAEGIIMIYPCVKISTSLFKQKEGCFDL